MREIIAKVLNNKNILLSNKSFGNKLDNSITKVIFTDIEDNANLANKYVAFYSPSSNIFLFPLNSEDNSFIVTSNLTTEAGTWSMIYLATNTAITEEGINSEYKSFISNAVDFSIEDNFLDDTIEEVVVDENLSIIYEQLEMTINYLNSAEFKEDLINNLHISESDIQLIINNLKNDEEFRADMKGEDGTTFIPTVDAEGNLSWSNDNGKENPETVNIRGPKGADGTMTFEDLTEEQKESLKGDDGVDGVGITNIELKETDKDGNNVYTITLSDNTTYDFTANKGDKGDPGKDGTMTFEELTEEQKESLKGEPGESGADGTTFIPSIDAEGNLSWSNEDGKENPSTVNIKGPQGKTGNDGEKGEKGDPGDKGDVGKSAYEIYKADFEYSPLVNGNKLGGRQLNITDLDNLTPWEINIIDNNNRILYIYIKEDAKYIQDMTTLEIINFNEDLEAIIPEDYEYFYSIGFEKFPDIPISTYKIGDLLSIKSIGDILSEDEWLGSLKGENGENGRSAYEIYLNSFSEDTPLNPGDKLGGKLLKIIDSDNLTPWEFTLIDTNDRILYIYIKEDAKYIQDMTTLEKVDFFDLEAVIPEAFGYLRGFGTITEYPDTINIPPYYMSDLLATRSIGSGLSEDEWIDSLKGEDYVLTEEDKTEIAEKVEGSFIISGAIERIEIVDALPETEETGVLYLVKG